MAPVVEPMRGANEMTMDEVWEHARPRRRETEYIR
jgi:hypothetical protein